jgi:hypothetical protein
MTSEHKQLWRTLLSRVRLIARTTSRGSAEEVAATGELAAVLLIGILSGSQRV